MRKKIKRSNRRSAPSKVMPGTAAGTAAATYLTLPAIEKSVPGVIAGEKDELLFELLHLMSYRIDVSGNYRSELTTGDGRPVTPAELMSSCLGEWVDERMNDNFVRFFNPSFALVNSDSLDDFFYDSTWRADKKPGLFFQGLGIEGIIPTFTVLDRLVELEDEHPGLGQHILTLLDLCPLKIQTPSDTLDDASYLFWCGEPNEKERQQELEDEYEDSGELKEAIGLYRSDFDESYPAWMLGVKIENCQYFGAVSAPVKKLQNAYRQWQATKQLYKWEHTNIDGILPAMTLEFCDSHEHPHLSQQTIDLQAQLYSEVHGLEFLAPFWLQITTGGGKYESDRMFDILDAVIDYGNAAIDMIKYLEGDKTCRR